MKKGGSPPGSPCLPPSKFMSLKEFNPSKCLLIPLYSHQSCNILEGKRMKSIIDFIALLLAME